MGLLDFPPAGEDPWLTLFGFLLFRDYYGGHLPDCWQQYSGAEVAECLFW